MCEIFRTGVLAGLPISGPVIPDQVLAPPSEPIIPNEVQAPPTTQLLQFRTEPPQPNDALIKLTSLVQTVQQQTNANQQTNADRQTGPSQTPGAPPACAAAAAAAARRYAGPDGEAPQQRPAAHRERASSQNESRAPHVGEQRRRAPTCSSVAQEPLGRTLLAQQSLSALGRTAFRLQRRRRPLGARRHPRAGGQQHRRGGACRTTQYNAGAARCRPRPRRSPRAQAAIRRSTRSGKLQPRTRRTASRPATTSPSR